MKRAVKEMREMTVVVRTKDLSLHRAALITGREGKGQDSWYMEIESPALQNGLHVGEEREEHNKGDWCIFLFPQNTGYRRRDRRVLGTIMSLSGGSV